MSRSNRLAITPVSTKDFSTITTSYSAMDNNTPTARSSSLILFQNFTDISVMMSIDGSTDHFPLASDSFLLLDLDKYINEPQVSFAACTVFSVKQLGATAATVGKIYISIFYPEIQ